MPSESPANCFAGTPRVSAETPIVLVVDDDPRVAEGLQRSLRGRAELLSASSGSNGRELANSRNDIDLLVLDLTMPEYDAVEFLADLREDGIFLPIVLISGQGPNMLEVVQSLARAQGFTVVDVLAKPFHSSRLIGVLETFECQKAL